VRSHAYLGATNSDSSTGWVPVGSGRERQPHRAQIREPRSPSPCRPQAHIRPPGKKFPASSFLPALIHGKVFGSGRHKFARALQDSIRPHHQRIFESASQSSGARCGECAALPSESESERQGPIASSDDRRERFKPCAQTMWHKKRAASRSGLRKPVTPQPFRGIRPRSCLLVSTFGTRYRHRANQFSRERVG
jgi:hypothetical protein